MKTGIGKLLASIVSIFGSIFHHVLSGAEQTFNQLPQATKDSLIHGSGILEIINSMIGSTAASVEAAITEKYPDVNATNMEAGLFAIAHAFGLLPNEGDLHDCIAKLQAYISSQKGTVWEDIMHSASLLLATVLAPIGTKLGALSSLLEYVYQTFIKKS